MIPHALHRWGRTIRRIRNLISVQSSPVMLDKISWLHLSDFHFRTTGDSFSQTVSCDELLGDIPSRLLDEYPLQFVLVTGDIAFSGQASEYELASTFFVDLASKIGLSLDRICIVPGNHDVDREPLSYLLDGVRLRLTSQQAIDEFLARDAERTLLMERQSAFRGFRDQLLADVSIYETEDGLARIRPFDLGGLRVCVLELNSAWLSGNNDRPGNLILGERQVIGALALVEGHRPHLTIALAHHPPDWLAEFDRIPCSNRLFSQLNVFHIGHLHWPQTAVVLSPGSQCLHSAAGSSHETRHYKNSYNVVEYDLGNAQIKIRHFEYRIDSGGFQETTSVEYTVPSRRDVPSSAAEIANLLCVKMVKAKPYAGYMAALLTGNLDEVPISLDTGQATFGSRSLSAEHQFGEVVAFLRVSNLLKLQDEGMLSQVILDHVAAITGFAELLSRMSSSDPQFAELLESREAQAQTIAGMSYGDGPTYQERYLEELAADGALEELIEAATRYSESFDQAVSIPARRYLAGGLLRSGDQESRRQGQRLAFQNIEEPWSEAGDHCLAGAAAESFGENEAAERIALGALDSWPRDEQVRNYCRSLAMRTGSNRLRLRLDETKVDGQ